MTQREKIISQAADMFVELGIKSIRMDDIAGALGISKRTLYEMFADKEELLYLCITHLQERDWNMVDSATAGCTDLVEALFTSFRVILDNSERRRRMSTNLQKFYPQLYARVAEQSVRTSLARLRSTMNLYIAEGLFSKNIDVDLSITIFYYTAVNIFGRMNNVVLPDGVTEKKAFMYTMVHFFRGLSTARGMELIDQYIERHAKDEVK